ncbi:MAG: alanine:cation symporter family protein [Oscillospiraceae bacterium]|nr:alanine:cation symporter family protein [Oscillospiraceae bacterium]
MEEILAKIAEVNSVVYNFVWVTIGIVLLLGSGFICTVITKAFQFTHFGHWVKETIGSIFTDKNVNDKSDKRNISQFQALCTALSATVGTGNISGTATAIVFGGPGAIFWMWVAAILGMMTNFSENVLGIFYRRKNEQGEWCGGAMYYLKDGLGAKKGCKWIGSILAVLFSIFCIFASFGIGNLSQMNSIAVNLDSAFGIPNWFTGAAFVIIAGLVIVGGLKRIASVTEKIVPTMVVLYLIGTIAIFIANIDMAGAVFASIFKNAFGVDAVAGGFAGIVMKEVVTWGCKRGVFSNEAGLGSSVMVHSCSNVKEPVKQGMWGIFEVFVDTLIVCTLSAFAVLSSGVVDLTTGQIVASGITEASALVGASFETLFGGFGKYFIAIAILLFAFSTVLGWSVYGTKAWEYLFGTKATIVYKVIFVSMVFVGPMLHSSLAWDVSDTFNGLMMIPNLIGVIVLSPVVYKITKNYVDRVIKGKHVEPMLSVFKEINEEHSKEVIK